MNRRRGPAHSVLAGVLSASLAASPALAGPQDEPAPPERERGAPDRLRSADAPLSAAEREVLDEIERDFARYQQAAERHHERIGAILYREYKERRQKLQDRYAAKMEAAEGQKRRKHLEAIALLEEFLRKYPGHPEFTPDAMFRLANLYLDEANYEFEKAFDDQFDDPTEPPAPGADETEVASDDGAPDDGDASAYAGPDYSKSIALWRETITKFPDYRQKAGTLYLLGYYLKQVGRDREALQAYRGLVCANGFDPNAEPPPRPSREQVRRRLTEESKAAFVNPYRDCEGLGDKVSLIREAWVRGVGDIHFNTPGELNEAIAAYKKVADLEESEFYDEALYKLAWSYYRNDDFLKGIKAFDESVQYSDQLVAQGKEPLELRPEAIQYIAVSFTDPWSVDEQPDPQRSFDRAFAFYKDRLDEPHVRDVFVKLGDTFKILEAHEQAIASWRLAIDNWPLHAKNPVVHQNIVSSLEALGDRDAADEEATKLASLYARGSEWYEANQTNREAMDDMARIGERMLRAAAENRHRAAQKARQDYEADPTPEGKEAYIARYEEAAALYERFIEEYPTSDEIYEYTYRLAETRFFAEHYLEAVAHYKWVRDHRELSEKRFEPAARSVVQSYQKAIDQKVASGELPDPDSPTVEELRDLPQPVEPKPIPSLYRKQQEALDHYQELVNDPQSAPKMALLAALIPYRFHHLDDAASRFDTVMDRFCGADEAAKAKDGLLAIYETRGQDEKFEATNQRFIDQQCGDEEAIKLARAQNRSKRFRDAEALFEDERYAEAAQAFYAYYKKAPEDGENRPVALYNAAIAYDRSGKPKTATYLFEEFTSNESSQFRDSPYYLEALYLTAVSNQRAFDYDAAVDNYLRAVEVASEDDRPEPPGERSLEQIRLDALYNAAVLRELDRVYDDPQSAPGTGAVSLYQRYARQEPDRRKSDRALWAVARVYASAQEPRNAARAFATWRGEFGKDEGNGDDYVFSFYRTAELYADKGAQQQANRYRRQTIEAWDEIGAPKGTKAADMAAEHAFYFAEREYKGTFEPYTIDRVPTNEKAAERVLDRLDNLTTRIRDRFTAVGKYESSFWGLAAVVRVGDTMFYSGQKVLQAPVPKQIRRLDRKHPEREVLLKYQDALNQNLVAPKQKAAKQQWEKAVAAGERSGVSNEWTELAQQRLHDFISQEDYPVLRDPIVEGTEEP